MFQAMRQEDYCGEQCVVEEPAIGVRLLGEAGKASRRKVMVGGVGMKRFDEAQVHAGRRTNRGHCRRLIRTNFGVRMAKIFHENSDLLTSAPIGIFDSGMGGLTVAKAVSQQLPSESIVYFGDTAHAPWGDKSVAAIQAYAVKICGILLHQHCKLILIACNSASAVAYDLVKEYVGHRVTVIDVVNPMVDYLATHYSQKRVGLIGTQQTVGSDIYGKKIQQRGISIQFNALATPLLVPLIESGERNPKVMEEVIKSYLLSPQLQNIDALVLGCTHYPLIKEHINAFYAGQTAVLDATDLVAWEVKNHLQVQGLLAPVSQLPQRIFYSSDYTQAFSALARRFFDEPVRLERYALWD